MLTDTRGRKGNKNQNAIKKERKKENSIHNKIIVNECTFFFLYLNYPPEELYLAKRSYEISNLRGI